MVFFGSGPWEVAVLIVKVSGELCGGRGTPKTGSIPSQIEGHVDRIDLLVGTRWRSRKRDGHVDTADALWAPGLVRGAAWKRYGEGSGGHEKDRGGCYCR